MQCSQRKISKDDGHDEPEDEKEKIENKSEENEMFDSGKENGNVENSGKLLGLLSTWIDYTTFL